MKRKRFAKNLIDSIIGHAGFRLIWIYMSEKQKNLFLNEILNIPDINRALSKINEPTGNFDEDEDTEEE